MTPVSGQLLVRSRVQAHTAETWEDALSGRPARMQLRESTLHLMDPEPARVTPEQVSSLFGTYEQVDADTAARLRQNLRMEHAAQMFTQRFGGQWRVFDPGTS